MHTTSVALNFTGKSVRQPYFWRPKTHAIKINFGKIRKESGRCGAQKQNRKRTARAEKNDIKIDLHADQSTSPPLARPLC